MEEDTEKTVQVISPIHADTTEAELHNLKQGNYLVFVEVHVSPHLSYGLMCQCLHFLMAIIVIFS